MSKLNELIEKLCPDGVKYKKFNDVATYLRGVSYSKTKEVNDGRNGYKLLRANNITLSSNVLNFNEIKVIDFSVNVKENQMLMKNDILICAGSGSKEHIGKVAFISENIDYTFGGFMGVIRCKSNIIHPRYMFHIMTSQIFKNHLHKVSNSSTINNINNDTWKDFNLPVPPMEVQCEIVRILDKLTRLETELEEKLEAELEARKKQYEYYRDKLLNFDETANPCGCTHTHTHTHGYSKEQIKWIELGNIGCVRMCKRILKNQTNTETGIPFYKIGTFGKKADAYISEKTYNEYKNKYKFPKKGDILISCSGTIGKIVVYNGEPAYFQDSNIVWLEHDESIVLNKYLKYCYLKNPWNVSTGGTIARLYNDNILKTKIPVPSLEMQERIANTLDRFEKLCNDISEGLPAEIEARKKQYEYYRDKLLTFKELKVNE